MGQAEARALAPRPACPVAGRCRPHELTQGRPSEDVAWRCADQRSGRASRWRAQRVLLGDKTCLSAVPEAEAASSIKRARNTIPPSSHASLHTLEPPSSPGPTAKPNARDALSDTRAGLDSSLSIHAGATSANPSQDKATHSTPRLGASNAIWRPAFAVLTRPAEVGFCPPSASAFRLPPPSSDKYISKPPRTIRSV